MSQFAIFNRTVISWVIVALAVLWPVAVRTATGDWPKLAQSTDFNGGVELHLEMDSARAGQQDPTDDNSGHHALELNQFEYKRVSPMLGQRALKTALSVLSACLLIICVLLVFAYSDLPHLVLIVVLCQGVQEGAIYFLAWQQLIGFDLLTLCAVALLNGVLIDNLVLIFEAYRRKVMAAALMQVETLISAAGEAVKEEQQILIRAIFLGFIIIAPLLVLGGVARGLATTIFYGCVIVAGVTSLIVSGLLQSRWLIKGMDASATQLTPKLGLRFDLFSLNKALLVIYCLALVAAAGRLATQGLAWGIDLTGGLEMHISGSNGMDAAKLEALAANHFKKTCSARSVHSSPFETAARKAYVVQVPGLDGLPGAADALGGEGPSPEGYLALLKSKLSSDARLDSAEFVGGALTSEKRVEALWIAAAGVLLLGLSLYFTYGTRIALAILSALIGDTFIALGAMSWLGISLSIAILSALLAVAGYSVYDSVVVAGYLARDAARARTPVLESVAIAGHVTRGYLLSPGHFSDDAFAISLSNLSRRLVLTVLTTAIGAVGIAVFCDGLLHEFGVVMATGTIFGMMSTVAIVVRALGSKLVSSPQPVFA